MNGEHSSPGRLFFGTDSVERLAQILDPGIKYALITDSGLALNGLAQKVLQRMLPAGVTLEIFSGVEPEPDSGMVQKASEFCRDRGLAGVIGLGGGSCLDAAKATAVLLSKEKPLRYYGDGNWVKGRVIPLYAVPTTAGTGSEATRVAVITDPERMEKMAIRGEHLAPLAAALDPSLLAGTPAHIAAQTGADALTHAVEAFVSLNANPFTDALATAAIRMIAENLRAYVADPADEDAAMNMLMASCLAGQAFTNAGLGLAHSIGEPVGAYHHIGHGLACALYLPVVMEFNLPAAKERFARIARLFGEKTEGLSPENAGPLALSAVKRLFMDTGLALTFAQAGFDFNLNDQMVADVWPQYSTSCNPRKPDEAELRALFLRPGDETWGH